MKNSIVARVLIYVSPADALQSWALVNQFLIIVNLRSRHSRPDPRDGPKWRARATFPSSRKPRRTVTTFSGRLCWLRFSIRSTAWESRLI